jgi:GH15 family glucan-1,4-alpha-glucosidase
MERTTNPQPTTPEQPVRPASIGMTASGGEFVRIPRVAFLLCSFWLVDNLVGQLRLEEAEQLYASLCARASPLGLLSEQIDPSSGELTANFPQAFSHIGVIASGVTLARARGTAR